MGFWEFAETLVRNMMEDPKERAKKRREYLYEEKENAKRRMEMYRIPLRPYGYWTFEKMDYTRRWEARISNMPGRRDPYASISADPFGDMEKASK